MKQIRGITDHYQGPRQSLTSWEVSTWTLTSTRWGRPRYSSKTRPRYENILYIFVCPVVWWWCIAAISAGGDPGAEVWQLCPAHTESFQKTLLQTETAEAKRRGLRYCESNKIGRVLKYFCQTFSIKRRRGGNILSTEISTSTTLGWNTSKWG